MSYCLLSQNFPKFSSPLFSKKCHFEKVSMTKLKKSYWHFTNRSDDNQVIVNEEDLGLFFPCSSIYLLSTRHQTNNNFGKELWARDSASGCPIYMKVLVSVIAIHFSCFFFVQHDPLHYNTEVSVQWPHRLVCYAYWHVIDWNGFSFQRVVLCWRCSLAFVNWNKRSNLYLTFHHGWNNSWP